MLSAPSQVLVRNQDLFAQGRWLIANPTEAAVFDRLQNPDLHGFHQYFDVFSACIGQRPAKQHTFTAAFQADEAFDGAIIYMPKSKEHASMLIANVAACVKKLGNIFLVGENKSGIKSAGKLFNSVTKHVNKIDSARHCALYCAHLEHSKPFKLETWLTYKNLDIGKTSVDIAFLPGVFSSGELDAGTKLLLDNIPPTTQGQVLDFACGAGVIACALGKLHPDVTLTLSDVSALAVYCSEKSLEKNALKGKVVPSDGLTDVKGDFDFVFTNPPFHTGIKTDYTVTTAFIQQIKQHLKGNSGLTLVANRFLPYPDLLKSTFGQVKTLAQTSKFSLYYC